MQLCLRMLRLKLGLSQAEVAAKAGCTRAAISHWECQRHWPTLEMIPRLAQALNVPEALLLDLRPPDDTAAA